MTSSQKPKKKKNLVTDDAKIEKLIHQRDAANRGLEKILKKMKETNKNQS